MDLEIRCEIPGLNLGLFKKIHQVFPISDCSIRVSRPRFAKLLPRFAIRLPLCVPLFHSHPTMSLHVIV